MASGYRERQGDESAAVGGARAGQARPSTAVAQSPLPTVYRAKVDGAPNDTAAGRARTTDRAIAGPASGQTVGGPLMLTWLQSTAGNRAVARMVDAAWVQRQEASAGQPSAATSLDTSFASAKQSGDWARAAEMWEEIGCPYEAALALSTANDDDALRRALGEFHRLGAGPAATVVSRGLRKRGARGLPRGPRPATRRNPANLTSRELDVLRLVAQGLRNAEIAERLFLSTKTVDQHVGAVLRKLGAHTRSEASAQAIRLGVLPQDP